jgi:hypothetical protein
MGFFANKYQTKVDKSALNWVCGLLGYGFSVFVILISYFGVWVTGCFSYGFLAFVILISYFEIWVTGCLHSSFSFLTSKFGLRVVCIRHSHFLLRNLRYGLFWFKVQSLGTHYRISKLSHLHIFTLSNLHITLQPCCGLIALKLRNSKTTIQPLSGLRSGLWVYAGLMAVAKPICWMLCITCALPKAISAKPMH